jgi:hypothetical protein
MNNPPITFLGGSSHRMGDQNINELYRAENELWVPNDEAARKTVSLKGARDLIGEAIHHPAMDEVPGIEFVRANYSPKDVSFHKNLSKNLYDVHPYTGEISNITAATVQDDPFHPERNNRMQFSTRIPMPRGVSNPGRNQVPLAFVTHETTHRLLNDAQFGGYAADHEWPMARLHVHLVRNILGNKHANALRDYYDKLGVDYGNKKI